MSCQSYKFAFTTKCNKLYKIISISYAYNYRSLSHFTTIPDSTYICTSISMEAFKKKQSEYIQKDKA